MAVKVWKDGGRGPTVFLEILNVFGEARAEPSCNVVRSVVQGELNSSWYVLQHSNSDVPACLEKSRIRDPRNAVKMIQVTRLRTIRKAVKHHVVRSGELVQKCVVRQVCRRIFPQRADVGHIKNRALSKVHTRKGAKPRKSGVT